jgi:hypothetical protein
VNNEHEANELESTNKQQTENPEENGTSENEFKLTVRKLEMPVRPRGVLAE